MTVFKLPDLGEGLSEAEILRWHVAVGDHVEADAPMLSVETAKAVVEVPSPVSGRIIALHAQPGDRIEIGAPLVEFDVDSESAGGAASADAGTVVGHMPAGQSEDETGAAPRLTAGALAAGAGLSSPASPARIRALPAARALARSLGVALEHVHGSGRDGAISVEDVLAAAGLPRHADAAAPAAQRPAGAAAAAHTAQGEVRGEVRSEVRDEVRDEVRALRGLRRAMAESMAQARDSVAACSVFDDADLSAWRARDYTPRVLRALAAAARAEPALNAWYEPGGERRTLLVHVDVGMAVDTPQGLLVPVLRGVESQDLQRLQAEVERLKQGAHARTLPAEELRGYSIMLSNFGSLAGRYATPVVVPPAVAILGTGRVQQDVVAVDGRPAVHPRMPLSLTFDHRVVTGGEAVRFLAALIADLERAE